ncbi:MAG: protocatechuate 3,4-dioxygenase subunit alpha [Pseudomonadota bacterium]
MVHRFGAATHGQTPSQTAGPYVHIGLMPRAAGFEGFGGEIGADIAGPDAPGQRISVQGMVLDGAGEPVRDAVVESWQADPDGRYASAADPRGSTVAGFRGYGRVAADFATGLFTIRTVKPGSVPVPVPGLGLGPGSVPVPGLRSGWGPGPGGGAMAPHLALWIVARGINIGLHTRMLFADEEAANAACPFLARIDPARRDTLLARAEGDGVYRFTIRLQGPGETVFLEV